MDRIDVQVDVPAVKVSDLNNEQAGESSAIVAARVAQAREIQAERYKDYAAENPLMLNARADGKLLEETAPLAADARDLLNRAMEASRFSARAYYRLLRVARTVADLEGCRSGVVSREIKKYHMAEALSNRRVVLG